MPPQGDLGLVGGVSRRSEGNALVGIYEAGTTRDREGVTPVSTMEAMMQMESAAIAYYPGDPLVVENLTGETIEPQLTEDEIPRYDGMPDDIAE